jgi:hypothetical protein
MNPFSLTEVVKETDRDEKEFRAFNKTISFTLFTGKDSNLTILSNSSFKIF